MKKRKYLGRSEIEKLLSAIPDSLNYHRDYCILTMSFIHGLRVSELRHLRLSDIDFHGNTIFISRLKNGSSTIHPLQKNECQRLKTWLSQRKEWCSEDIPWLFISKRGAQLSRQRIYTMMRKYGELANLAVSVNPHMLRHACGYALANAGKDTRLIQDYLGHRNIRHTVIYTASNSERFSSVAFDLQLDSK